MTIRLFLAAAAIAGLVASCQSDTGGANQTAASARNTPGKAERPAEPTPATRPDWLDKSRTWPDTIHWVFDSTFELTYEGLFVRIRPEVGLDISNMSFPDQKPLIARVIVTMRPVTDWPQAKGYKLDSLVAYDPIRKTTIKSLPLLSFERGYTDNTVRTTFLPNMAIQIEPDLDKGQPIDIRIFMTWDHRTIIGTFPPLSVKYLRANGEW
ncbi:MAG: hypothetical protein AB1752_06920 [Candidatus Zixiibacteriota bacterium]